MAGQGLNADNSVNVFAVRVDMAGTGRLWSLHSLVRRSSSSQPVDGSAKKQNSNQERFEERNQKDQDVQMTNQKAQEAIQDAARKHTSKKQELSNDSHRGKMVQCAKKTQGSLRSSVFRPLWAALVISNLAVGYPHQNGNASALEAINHCPLGLPLFSCPPHGTCAMPWLLDIKEGGQGKCGNQHMLVAWPTNLGWDAVPSCCFCQNNHETTSELARAHESLTAGGSWTSRVLPRNSGPYLPRFWPSLAVG